MATRRGGGRTAVTKDTESPVKISQQKNGHPPRYKNGLNGKTNGITEKVGTQEIACHREVCQNQASKYLEIYL